MQELTHEQQASDGGIRFGLRGMIVATAVAGAILALIRLWGPLVGLAVSSLLSLVGFTGVFCWAMVWRIIKGREVDQSRTMIFCERAGIGLVAITTLLFVALVVAGGAAGVTAILGKRAVQAEWHKELGFTHRPSDIYRDPDVIRYVEVTKVAAGGTFESLGIREGEVIAVEEGRFFRQLEMNRGDFLTVDVGSGGTTGYWKDYTVRQVEIPVPP